jgi:hypothetical protein
MAGIPSNIIHWCTTDVIYKSLIPIHPFVIYITNYGYIIRFINPPVVFFFLIGIHSINPLAPLT